MKSLMISGRIASDLVFGKYLNRYASDLVFGKYLNRYYCIIELECYKGYNKTEIIPCVTFCKDVELLQQYIHKGDFIAGDGYITTHRDDEGKTSVIVVLSNFGRFVYE